MSVEEDSAIVQGGPGDAHVPDLLLYDLSKYLLTLCLLVLGGVLTLTETAASRLPTVALTVVIVSLVASGLLSVACITTVVAARYAGRPARHARTLNNLAVGLLGCGVGAFLAIWTEQLF